MASTLTTFDFAIKEYYTPQRVENLVEQDRPFLSMVDKNDNFTGDPMPVPIITTNPQGVSGAFATAGTSATNLGGSKFNVQVGDFFGAVDIGDKVLKLSRNNLGAFLENKKSEIDGLYEQMADDISLALQRGNGGTPIGRRSSASTNVITLTDPYDVSNFEVGMTVVASAADGSGGSDALRTGSTTVASVQRESGTVTLTSAAGISSFSDNDYLFRAGNFAGNTSVKFIYGLDFIISPSASPAPLYGLTRTTDATRLAGCRLTTAQLAAVSSMEERLQLLVSTMTGRYRAKPPTIGLLNPEDWNTLSISLQSRGVQPMQDKDSKFGFECLSMSIGGARVKFYAEPHRTKGTAMLLRDKHWTLWSAMKLIHPKNGDGLQMLRKTDSNDYRFELLSYPALVTNAPLYNGRCPV